MMNVRYLLLLVCVCVISACGGGGGGGATYHIAISHSGTGLTCESSTITITLHEDDNHNVTAVEEDETVAITLQPSVGSSSTFNVTVPKDSSSVTFDITQTSAASVDIDAVGDNASAPDDQGAEDPPIIFTDTAFRFAENGVSVAGSSIDTQVAGVSSSGTQSLELRAIRTDTLTKACTSAVSGSLTINMAYECNSPSTCAGDTDLVVSAAGNQSLTGANSVGGLTYQGVPMTFDADGVASFSLSYAEAGQITLHATTTVAASGSNPAFTLAGSSNAFWVRPDSLKVTAETLTGTTLDATSATDTKVQRAAGYFKFIVSGVNNAGVVTEYYTPGNIQLKLARTGPSSNGVEGDLTYAAGSVKSTLLSGASFGDVTLTSFVSGVSTYDEATYSEVGLISVDIQDTNYGSGITIPAPVGGAVAIGRFIPDHYELSVSEGTFDSACNNFTYIGQAFSYAVSSQPTITVTAKDGSGDDLQNYLGISGGAQGFKKLVNTSMLPMDSTAPFIVTSNNIGVDSVTAMPVSAVYQPPGVADDSTPYRTVFTLSASDSFSYTRNANAEVADFDIDLPLSVTGLTDGDGITAVHAAGAVNSNGDDIAGLLIDSTNPFVVTMTAPGEKQFFGRFRLENAFGPETAPLALPVNIEYLGSNGFVVNGLDDCTAAVTSANFDLNVIDDDAVDDDGDSATDNPAPGVIAGIVIDSSSTTGTIANDPFDDGVAGFSFSAPGAGSTAAIEVQLLDSANDYPWLLYNWDGVDQLSDGDMFDDLPSSTATFGSFRGHDRILYWQEVTN